MSFAQIVYQQFVPFVDLVLIPLMYSLAFIFFLIGIVSFLFSMEDEKRKEGKKFILWGLLGMVVLFSVWGIIKILLGVLTGA